MERNENGFSGFNFTNNTTGRNSRCPGTGSYWQGNGGSAVPDTASKNNRTFPDEMSGCGSRQLAMVYSPSQCWRMLYSPEKGLECGTLFEELDKPLEDCVNG